MKKVKKTNEEKTIYNSKGNIEKFTSYDKNGKPEITHIYVYY